MTQWLKGRTIKPLEFIVENNKLLDPINKSRLHEEIVSQLQRKIIKGELVPGDKLPSERDLAYNLNVNRATVREALKKLELMGLIEIRHGDGIYVLNFLDSANLDLIKAYLFLDDEINPDVLQNILAIRKILSPEFASMAAHNRTHSQLEEFEAVLANNSLSTLEKDLKIHHLIARSSNNLAYVIVLNFFQSVFNTLGFLYFDDPTNQAATNKFHKDIFIAIKNRDAEEARRIMYDVMVYAENMVYTAFENYMKKANSQ